MIVPLVATAQNPVRKLEEKPLVLPDTLMPPSGDLIALDTIPTSADSLAASDSTKIMPRSDISTDITYYGEDSIVSDFTENKIYLHKQAWFEYGPMRLEADLIVIDWANSELYASGVTD
ncbi:MAG: LPS-assembly protein LptD, partial [Algoriphagus sp.]